MPRTKHKGQPDVLQSSALPVATGKLVPTGSTLFNLACSDNPFGAFALGTINNVIGDSSSGKTILALSVFAEMSRIKRFHDYRCIYDDAEQANQFDVRYLFGERCAHRIEPPSVDKDGYSSHSDTMQDFHYHVLDAVEQGDPFVYILDSLDALDDTADQEKVEVQRKAHKKGEDSSGTYGMSKAKNASWILRNLKAKIKKTSSMLVVISQTRTNISPGSFVPKTRSGGKALKFYSTHELWTAVRGQISRQVHGKSRQVGVEVRVKWTKNKLIGKTRTVDFPVYYDYGIDDIGSCVDWLVREGVWIKRKQTVIARGLGIKGTKDKLIRLVEERGLERELQKVTGRAWLKIEEQCKLHRKRRY